MDGMVFDHEDDEEPLHIHTGSFSPEEEKDEDGKTKGKGEKGRAGIFGEGEGVYFDEADGFDPTELQGLPYYDFVSARHKGLPLRRRINDQSDQYLRSFIDEADLREHVYEVVASEREYPTLLLDSGSLMQFHLYAGDLQRVRVSSDIEPEIGVRIAIKAFLAAGKSIDPRNVRFGNSQTFEDRMKPVWTRVYNEMQRGNRTPHIDIPSSGGARAAVRRSPTVGI